MSKPTKSEVLAAMNGQVYEPGFCISCGEKQMVELQCEHQTCPLCNTERSLYSACMIFFHGLYRDNIQPLEEGE